MYSEKVMDHFQNPRNVGEIEDASGVGTVGNAKCGDIMRMFLDIDENGIIREAKFKTFGCGAAVATSSMATELVKGKTIQEALQVTNKAVMEAGYRTGKGQDHPGSFAGNEQGGNGGSGRTASRKGTLLTFGRGSHPCSSVGLCREEPHHHRRPAEAQE